MGGHVKYEWLWRTRVLLKYLMPKLLWNSPGNEIAWNLLYKLSYILFSLGFCKRVQNKRFISVHLVVVVR